MSLYDANAHDLKVLNKVLKQEFLPNLSKIFVRVNETSVRGPSKKRKRTDSFLYEFAWNSISKLEKLALQRATISADDLKILSEKLISAQLTELDMTHSSDFTGNLSVLFTHRLPILTTLKLRACGLNSNDV